MRPTVHLSFRQAECVRHWKIICDFDGTISLTDATDQLLAHCAAPGWRELEYLWSNGAIGSRECMSRQVAMLDASERELNQVLDTIRIDPAFARFVARARESALELVIVSDGLDRAIHRILDNHGLGGLPVIANRLQQVGERRWRMQSPHAAFDCRVQSGTCKCACTRSQHPANRPNMLLIGDGRSDICVASRADFVFAKDRLLDHCRQARIAHRAVHGFDDVIALLPDLLAGDLDRRPLPHLPPPSKRIEYA